MLEIYKDLIEDPKMLKASDLQQHITEVKSSKINTLNGKVLHAEHKWDVTCKKLSLQSNGGNKIPSMQ